MDARAPSGRGTHSASTAVSSSVERRLQRWQEHHEQRTATHHACPRAGLYLSFGARNSSRKPAAPRQEQQQQSRRWRRQ